MRSLAVALAVLLACGGADAKRVYKGSRSVVGGGDVGTADLTWKLAADSATTSQVGHKVYKSTSEFGLLTEETRTLVTTIADTTTLTYQVTALASGTWYFCIASYSATGIGGCSHIVSKVIP
jgi:hypothetical protein